MATLCALFTVCCYAAIFCSQYAIFPKNGSCVKYHHLCKYFSRI